MNIFWFFFIKKNTLSLARGRPATPARKRFFLQKEAKTLIHSDRRRGRAHDSR
jgi:hypothetical protein